MLWLAVPAHALDAAKVAEVATVAQMPVERVAAFLDGLQPDQSVLQRLSRPAENKPWHVYRDLFLTDERMAKGRAFRAAHADALARAEATYGVPASVVLGIIGVETMYGEKMGNDVIATALFTLGFHHDRRGSFFRTELGNYLRLAEDQHWDLTTHKGSYAGAMGMGQFMPSSYRKWAVDFDGDGSTDLFASADDAIGSVAHYLSAWGWDRETPIYLEAEVPPSAVGLARASGLDLDQTLGGLRRAGVTILGLALPDETRARLLPFDTEAGREYRVALQNFYVITRYNQSALYARAVCDLGSML